MYCHKCGEKNEDTNKYCIYCGQKLFRTDSYVDIEKFNEIKSENSMLKSKFITDAEKFILGAGEYLGGVDIPVGCYNMVAIKGEGSFETNYPEQIFFYLTNSKEEMASHETDCYKNLKISDKTKIKILGGVKVEFSFANKYDFSKELEEGKQEYNKKMEDMSEEIKRAKYEMETLNNDLIIAYYKFSDYENLTSVECKDKLLLLKQEEKELRKSGDDVFIYCDQDITRKTEYSIVRQILRTFNAECDNIMMNISLKNIDSVKKQIVKSYDTINSLYSVYDAGLEDDILELKLKQANLLYTYELKYQQEKDVQRAIKEQMMEEAKAQREIEEQKKKIEKDLQQHMGEVSRLMKYMQKTQADTEKQFYMDKIKELEDKIKSLESDKENVLEREANAKAGFVYIISNIGSFGDGIYKIGMTRRLEPMDRINELSSASVPFEFDVHAMIFSSDAPELENMLHKTFADKAVNKVNPRKEFFKVDIDEIEKVVKENYNDTVEFTKVPVAAEYRQTMNLLNEEN